MTVGARYSHVAAMLVAAALAGCGAAAPHAVRPAPGSVALLNGTDLSGWRTVQGAAHCEGGATILHGDRSDTTIATAAAELLDGEVLVHLRRPPGDRHAGPYTVGLRVSLPPAWRAVYFVCRPDGLEVCRGSFLDWFPAAELTAAFEKAAGPEVWRFVLKGGRIDCYRDGRLVLSYTDPDPRIGRIALTASRCRVEVLGVYWRPEDPQTESP